MQVLTADDGERIEKDIENIRAEVVRLQNAIRKLMGEETYKLMQKEFFTIQEVADLAGIGYHTVLNDKNHLGLIKGCKRNGKVYEFHRDQVRAYLAKKGKSPVFIDRVVPEVIINI